MKKPVGDQELALLQFLTEAPGSTVGEAAEAFGRPRDLARSTVLTMMERLRQKGYLTRRLSRGTYRYSPSSAADGVVRARIRQFVAQTLQGSVTPFVSYLSEEAAVSDEELAELQALVTRLEARKRGGR